MDQVDERILERLAEHDRDAWELAIDLGGAVSPSRVRERLHVLADSDFVTPYECQLTESRSETYWALTT